MPNFPSQDTPVYWCMASYFSAAVLCKLQHQFLHDFSPWKKERRQFTFTLTQVSLPPQTPISSKSLVRGTKQAYNAKIKCTHPRRFINSLTWWWMRNSWGLGWLPLAAISSHWNGLNTAKSQTQMLKMTQKTVILSLTIRQALSANPGMRDEMDSCHPAVHCRGRNKVTHIAVSVMHFRVEFDSAFTSPNAYFTEQGGGRHYIKSVTKVQLVQWLQHKHFVMTDALHSSKIWVPKTGPQVHLLSPEGRKFH